MGSVIVEYKDTGKVREIESAAVRRQKEYAMSVISRTNKQYTIFNGNATARSVVIEKLGQYPKGDYSDLKCWKNQRHARKNWMRHLCRISKCASSARAIMDKCIYPSVGSIR